jgi:hypothetical protein
MKISIGNKKDRDIWLIIQTNIENGYAVFSDENEFYVDVLSDGNTFVAPDVEFKKLENQ